MASQGTGTGVEGATATRISTKGMVRTVGMVPRKVWRTLRRLNGLPATEWEELAWAGSCAAFALMFAIVSILNACSHQ